LVCKQIKIASACHNSFVSESFCGRALKKFGLLEEHWLKFPLSRIVEMGNTVLLMFTVCTASFDRQLAAMKRRSAKRSKFCEYLL